MREILKTGSEIVISENTKNEVPETVIAMKCDAESNETTPAIILYRFHEDCEMFTKKDVKSWSRRTLIVEFEKKQGQIWNQRPLKRWRPLWTLPF